PTLKRAAEGQAGKSKSAGGKARKLIVVFIIKFVVIRGKPSRLAHTFNRGGIPSLAGNALSSGWRIMGAHRVNKGRAAHRSTGRRGRKVKTSRGRADSGKEGAQAALVTCALKSP